jgi:hypothetical protein
MAVSVIKRPRTNITNGAPVSCTVLPETTPASGEVDVTNAIVIKSAHGLVTGDYVYLKTNVERYNGFWYVTQNGANGFNISRDLTEDPTVPFIKWIQDAAGTYTAASAFSLWSCIHLPIVYKISNTLWPTNSADTTRTMTVTNSNGYCAIAASGDIKATGSAEALEFVKVTNAGDYNGVYQIIAYTNDTTFTIDLAYSSAADTALTAGNIQYYYNNYVVKVRIYGGLKDGHYFESQRTYELIATKDIIPDEDGVCTLSVHEVLREQIEVRNNTLLGTLPNNLDAFTMFYIEYAEVYDDSDGTTLSQITPSYTSDKSNFEGFAVNAVLPFKNVFSGGLSEYNTGDLNQKFLTEFVRPTIFTGQYSDISFLSNMISQDVEDVVNGDFPSALTPWTNSGSGETWTHGASRANVTVVDPQESKRFEQDYDFVEGSRYLIKYDEIIGSFDNTYTVLCYICDDTYALTQAVESNGTLANGTFNRHGIVTADANYTKIVFEVNLNTP